MTKIFKLVPGNLYEVIKGDSWNSSSIEFIEENFYDISLNKDLRQERGKLVMFLERKYNKGTKKEHPVFLISDKRMIVNDPAVEEGLFHYFKDIALKEKR